MPHENIVLDEGSLSRLHYEIIRGLIERCACPTNAALAERLGISTSQTENCCGLADIHGLVLHPRVCEPWVVHPFSVSPTLNWIKGRGRGWWAPCIAPIKVATPKAHQTGFDELSVHFAIPPARA
jgi:hypothetical protein